MSHKVKVVVRVRPAANFSNAVYKFDEGNDCVDIVPPAHSDGEALKDYHFKLDKLLVNSTQDVVFNTCAEEVIQSVMDGYNGTIMAYGQTGAGKTFSIAGGKNSFTQRGIIPRAISRIYNEVAARPENIITVRLSYVEIYNELVFDLLAKTSVADQKGDLIIYDGPKGAIFVKGLTLMRAGSEEEALKIFFKGDSEKAVAEHALNNASSRSHTLCSVYVESKSKVESSEKIVSSKLHLVDLAGSERLKKTNSEGLVMKEASYINKSLSYLEQVVLALGDKSRDHVPYRQSKLTHFLKDSLGGNCKTTMIANIFPDPRFLEESSSTLRFATRMMKVVNKPNVNIVMDNALLLKKYERDIQDLKQELAMHDTLSGRARIQYLDYSPDEVKLLEVKVKQYVEGEVDHLAIPSLRMVHESFSIFRRMIHGLQKELRDRPKNMASLKGGSTVGEGFDDMPPPPTSLEPGEGQVGQDENTGGFGVGMANAESRPAVDPDAMDEMGGNETAAAESSSRPQPTVLPKAPTSDKQTLFTEWKQKAGQPYEQKFQELRTELLRKKQRAKDVVAESRDIKNRIDLLKDQVARKRAAIAISSSNKDENVIDEEEYALLAAQQSEKAAYMQLLDEKRGLDSEILGLDREIQGCKAGLMQAFESWYAKKYDTSSQNDNSMFADTDLKEQYDKLEAASYGESYAFYRAQKTAALQKTRK